METLGNMIVSTTITNQSKEVHRVAARGIIVNEGKVSVTTLENPNAIKYDLTPGFTDSGFPGIIIGKPFKYDDMKGEAAAMKLVKKFGLTVGNDYDFWIGDLEEEYGDDIKKKMFVYFLNNENYEVDCYVFPDGVCALM